MPIRTMAASFGMAKAERDPTVGKAQIKRFTQQMWKTCPQNEGCCISHGHGKTLLMASFGDPRLSKVGATIEKILSIWLYDLLWWSVLCICCMSHAGYLQLHITKSSFSRHTMISEELGESIGCHDVVWSWTSFCRQQAFREVNNTPIMFVDPITERKLRAYYQINRKKVNRVSELWMT